jgi:hypothetical protein
MGKKGIPTKRRFVETFFSSVIHILLREIYIYYNNVLILIRREGILCVS